MQGPGEAERLEAVWAAKSTLAKGLSLFNSKPIKGARFLMDQGCIPQRTPEVRMVVHAWGVRMSFLHVSLAKAACIVCVSQANSSDLSKQLSGDRISM